MLLPHRLLSREIGERLLNLDHIRERIVAFQVSPEVFIRRFHLSDWKRKEGTLDGFVAFAQEKEDRLRIKAAHVFGRYASDRFDRALHRVKQGSPRKKYQYPGLSSTYRQVSWAIEGMAINDVKLDTKRDLESILRSCEADQLDLEVGWGDQEIIPCNLAFHRIHQKPLGFLLRVQVLGPVQKRGQKTLF